MFKNLMDLLEKNININLIKTRFSLSILMACMGDFLIDQGNVTPRCVVETKKACLHYLTN
jgi:hypothetical protein